MNIMTHVKDPINDTPPVEIPLRDPPLIRVLAQISFPPILSVEDKKFIAPFQEAIRHRYPNAYPEQTQGFFMGPLGPSLVGNQTAWRFTDAEGKWRISLTPNFISLEAIIYESRKDFLSRLQEITEALKKHLDPQICARIGLRYVSRLTGKPLEQVNSLIRPEMLGIQNTSIANYADLALSQAQFDVQKDKLLVRWGRLPANATTDPSTIEPINEPSWIFDLDMSTVGTQSFDVDYILKETENFASRIYTFFRWTITDDFLTLYKK